MRKNTTQAVEDYLKVIFEMTRGGERATTNQIAGRMGVTPASATGMIQKLAGVNPPLLDYEKHRGAALTASGEQVALEIIRHHRLLELFLQEKLGYSWDEVHGEADRLEHVISEELEERISQALGHPSYDPHGEPIPSREFKMPGEHTVRLSELRPGDKARVRRINNTDPDLLRYLASIGMRPHTRINVVAYSAFDGNLQVQVGVQEELLVLGPPVTRQIFVEMA